MLEKKIFIFKNWINEQKESDLFSATDIVWIGYKNYSSPSGVFYQAVHKSLPMIISDDGLLYNLNQTINVARAVNIHNPLSIIEGIDFVLKSKNKKNFRKNMTKFSKISDHKKWMSGFKKMHVKLYN